MPHTCSVSNCCVFVPASVKIKAPAYLLRITGDTPHTQPVSGHASTRIGTGCQLARLPHRSGDATQTHLLWFTGKQTLWLKLKRETSSAAAPERKTRRTSIRCGLGVNWHQCWINVQINPIFSYKPLKYWLDTKVDCGYFPRRSQNAHASRWFNK